MEANQALSCCIIGHGKLTVECAQHLLAQQVAIHAIVSKHKDVQAWAKAQGIACVSDDQDLVSVLNAQSFDYLFSIINPYQTASELLALPLKAAINFHDAPLPRYAGLHVSAWALVEQETTFGVTWHEMSANFDAGDIYVQKHFELEAEETAFSLRLKCFQHGLESFKALITALKVESSGTPLNKMPQDLSQRSQYFSYQRPYAAAILDWQQSSAKLTAQVRALSFADDDNPLAIAKLWTGEQVYLLTQVSVLGQTDAAQPGQILANSQGELHIACADAVLSFSGISKLADGIELSAPLLSACADLQVGKVLPVLGNEPLSTIADSIHQHNEALAKKEQSWLARLRKLEALTLEDFGAQPPKANARASSQGLAFGSLAALAQNCEASEAEIVAALFCLFLRRVHASEGLSVAIATAESVAISESEQALRAQLFARRLPQALDMPLDASIQELLVSLSDSLRSLRQGPSYAADLAQRFTGLPSLSMPVGVDFVAEFSAARLQDELLLLELDSDAQARFSFQADAISADKVAMLAEQFQSFVSKVLVNSNQHLAELALVSDAEREQSLVAWNQTDKAINEQACIHDLFAQQAQGNASACALAFRDQRLSYAELDKRATALAIELQKMGAGPDRLVGVFAERSIEMVVALLAVLKSGSAYVPLDPGYPRERIALMLEDSQASIVLTQSHLLGEVPVSGVQTLALDGFDYASNAGLSISEQVRPEHLAYVIYTSGSTGKPKGVMVEHRNAVNFIAGMDDTLNYQGEPGVWLAVTSISFDISVLEIFWSLARGFKVVIQEEQAAQFGAGPVQSKVAGKLDIGLFYFSSDAGPSHKTDRYRLLMEGAKFADDNGFATVWTPERHFHLFGGLYPNPSVTSAAVAALTKNVGIRAGSIVLPLHNPIRVAEEWSVVDNLSNGRVGFSFASGWHANDFSLKPENFDDRKNIMFESIETVRKLWHGESVEVLNGEGQPFEAKIYPAPVQEEPPIWITTAGNVETFRMAGERGFNILTNLLGQSIEDIRSKIAAYREGRKAKGHAGPGNVSVMVHTFVGNDVEEVKALVREPFSNYLKTSFDLVKIAPWAFPAFKQPSKEAAQDASFDASSFTDEDMSALIDHAFERYFETAGIFGTPESCIPLIDKLKQAGVDELGCLVDFGVEDQAVLDSLPYLNELRKLANPGEQGEVQDYNIAAQIERHQVTHFQCTPSMARILCSDEQVRKALCSLDKVLLGGEALPLDLAQTLSEGLKGELINVYGPTETTIWSTATHLAAPVTQLNIGRPIANTQVYLLDHCLQPVAIGMPGELLIGGKGVVRGYWQRPELTAERFIDHPLAPQSKLYRTGDLARYLEDGRLEFLGRLDHQVKLRGYRIELGEIEALINDNPGVKESVVVAPADEQGGQQLLAYVVPDDDNGATNSAHWQALWDQAYREGTPQLNGDTVADVTLNTAGWLDSFSGSQHQQAHMQEWVDATVARILEKPAKRILEVGCGTGMLLYRVAPHCQDYVGLDLSQAALDMIANACQSRGLSNVSLLQGAVDQIDLSALGEFDLVVINSVVQYFPSTDYLEQILNKVARVLTPAGRIFVGDVRHADLKPSFDLNVALMKSPEDSSYQVLSERVHARREQESELLLRPEFFVGVAAKLSQQAGNWGANIQLKRGQHYNEMSAYRYDVVLDADVPASQLSVLEVPAPSSLDGFGALFAQHRLALHEGTRLVICDLPNARLQNDLQRLSAFENQQDAPALLALAQSELGFEPEQLYRLGDNDGDDYDLELHWAQSGKLDCFDLYISAKGAGKVYRAMAGHAAEQAGQHALAQYALEPKPKQTELGVIDSIKASISAHLPEFMMPDHFVVLPALPLTPNGKVDRKALPAPQQQARVVEHEFVAPESDIEQRIAEVFCEMLNLEQVGTRDNFFELGANSLLIAQANNHLNQVLGQRVSLVAMYRYPTIAGLADYLKQQAEVAASGSAASSQSTDKASDRAERRKAAQGARKKRVQRRR